MTTSSSRYEIEGTLGHGGMATVYLAHDTVLGRRVALKVLAENLAADESFRARFLREARFAARVTHPNVVQIYDAGDDERGLYISMEYVEGESLAEELRRRGRLPPAEAVDVGLQLCAALDAAHAAGLVHRDVKPQNVLRAGDGTVKLGDFGIAHSHDSTALTAHGSVLGTAAYLAPEQARGQPVTAASDLYALGVVLYEALTGRGPHDGSSLPELLLRRERDPAPPPSTLAGDVPPALDSAILHCLEVRPDDRPASASALAAELTRALPATDGLGEAPTVVAATRPLPAGGRRRARRGLVAVAIAVLLALGLGLALLATRGEGSEARQAAPTTTRTSTPAAAIRQTTTAAAVQPPTTQQQPPTLSPCAALERRRQQLEDEKRALDAQKHAAKGKARRRAYDDRKHALDAERKALDKELKACR